MSVFGGLSSVINGIAPLEIIQFSLAVLMSIDIYVLRKKFNKARIEYDREVAKLLN